MSIFIVVSFILAGMVIGYSARGLRNNRYEEFLTQEIDNLNRMCQDADLQVQESRVKLTQRAEEIMEHRRRIAKLEAQNGELRAELVGVKTIRLEGAQHLARLSELLAEQNPG